MVSLRSTAGVCLNVCDNLFKCMNVCFIKGVGFLYTFVVARPRKAETCKKGPAKYLEESMGRYSCLVDTAKILAIF